MDSRILRQTRLEIRVDLAHSSSMINTHIEEIKSVLDLFCRPDKFIDIKVTYSTYLLNHFHFVAQLILALQQTNSFEDKNGIIQRLSSPDTSLPSLLFPFTAGESHQRPVVLSNTDRRGVLARSVQRHRIIRGSTPLSQRDPPHELEILSSKRHVFARTKEIRYPQVQTTSRPIVRAGEKRLTQHASPALLLL